MAERPAISRSQNLPNPPKYGLKTLLSLGPFLGVHRSGTKTPHFEQFVSILEQE